MDLASLYTTWANSRDLQPDTAEQIFAFADRSANGDLAKSLMHNSQTPRHIVELAGRSQSAPVVIAWIESRQATDERIGEFIDTADINLLVDVAHSLTKGWFGSQTLKRMWKRGDSRLRFCVLEQSRGTMKSWDNWFKKSWHDPSLRKEALRTLQNVARRYPVQGVHLAQATGELAAVSTALTLVEKRQMIWIKKMVVEDLAVHLDKGVAGEDMRWATHILACVSDILELAEIDSEDRIVALRMLDILPEDSEFALDLRDRLKPAWEGGEDLEATLAEGDITDDVLRAIADTPYVDGFRTVATRSDLTPEQGVLLLKENLYGDFINTVLESRSDEWCASLARKVWQQYDASSGRSYRDLFRALPRSVGESLAEEFSYMSCEVVEKMYDAQMGSPLVAGAAPASRAGSLDRAAKADLLALASEHLVSEADWETFEKLSQEFSGTFTELVRTISALRVSG